MNPLLAEALPTALEIAGAHAALLVRNEPGGPVVLARAGADIDASTLSAALNPAAPDPASSRHPLPEPAGILVLVGPPAPTSASARAAAAAMMGAVAARILAEQRLADLVERVDGAQQLANMGDYDWHIAADANRWSDQLYRIYGHEPGAFEATYDAFLAHIHPDDRERVRAVHARAYATGEPYEMVERIVRPDGTVRILASSGRVILGGDGTPERMAGTCIDITERVEAEEAREAVSAALSDAELRRRQAMEINDNVIQGLTAAVLSMRIGDEPGAIRYLERTLHAARHLMNDWLAPLSSRGANGAVRPGDLVRAEASTLGPAGASIPAARSAEAPAPTRAAPAGACRVLIAEDSRDVRFLLRRQLEAGGTCDVVGEAEDGAEAVQLAEALQPDVILLDLSMPTMDGLQALPLIRDVAPAARVVVMSGYAEGQMAELALAAGAVQYVEKGLRMNPVGLIAGLMETAGRVEAPAPPPQMGSAGS